MCSFILLALCSFALMDRGWEEFGFGLVGLRIDCLVLSLLLVQGFEARADPDPSINSGLNSG